MSILVRISDRDSAVCKYFGECWCIRLLMGIQISFFQKKLGFLKFIKNAGEVRKKINLFSRIKKIYILNARESLLTT